MQNPYVPQMNVPQMNVPQTPQLQNQHAPQVNTMMMARPQPQVNQMIAPMSHNNTVPKQINNNNNNNNYTGTASHNQLVAMARNNGGKSQETSFNEMSRNGILPECLYCDKKFPHAGQIRVHLKSHYGIRPYKCALCNYRHWYPTPVLSTHFKNVHGRKGQPSDVVTDKEEENKMTEKVEQEAIEVRQNQREINEGKPKKEKKIPDREGGTVYHEYYLGKYDDA